MIVLSAIAVFALAAIVIGRESRRLDAVAPRVIYDPDEAAAYVADKLPPHAAGQLTPAELAEVLDWHMAHLRAKGLQPKKVTDMPQSIDTPVVVEEDGAVGYLIGRAEFGKLPVTDEAMVMVVEAHLEYLGAIGAVGPEASDPDVRLPELGSGSTKPEIGPPSSELEN